MEKPIIEKGIRGTLKFLVFNRFYGFITRFDTREDIFVHGSEIRYINPMQFTRRCGDAVIFDLAVGVKGLEAVNVILNLAETGEEDLDEDNDGKDSIYLFDNMKGRFQKLPGGKPSGPIIMKKRSGPVSGTDDSLAGSEIDINMKSTLDSFSLHTYPSVSSLSKYPSMSTLSSISFDDSVVSWAIPRPDDEKPDMTDIVSVDMSDIDIGDMLDAEEDKVDQYDMVNVGGDKELDGKQIVTNNTLNPLVDRSNEVSSTDLPQIARVTLVELRGKSFKKIHEENMKRRMLLP